MVTISDYCDCYCERKYSAGIYAKPNEVVT